jgi:molybdopterin molybdotransferase
VEIATGAPVPGVERLTTHRPPTVTLLVPGNEVVTGGTPGPGQVRDSFTGLVTAITARAGGKLRAVRHVPDDPALLRAALDAAGGDVVAVSGSSSAGAAGPPSHPAHRPAGHLARTRRRLPPQPPASPRRPARRAMGGRPLRRPVAVLTLLEPLLRILVGHHPTSPPTTPVTGTAKLVPGSARKQT